MYMYSFMGSRFNCELLSDGPEVTFKYGGMSTDHVLVADIKIIEHVENVRLKYLLKYYKRWTRKASLKTKKKTLYNSNYGLTILL